VIHSFVKREDDYAIRISAFLASEYPNGFRAISDIANRLALTKPIASKIIHKLKKGNIVTSVRGRNGGVKLVNNPKTTSFLDILTAVGYNSTMNECLKNPSICPLVSFCKINLFWEKIELNIIDTLSKTYLSDFVIYESDLTTNTGDNNGSFAR